MKRYIFIVLLLATTFSCTKILEFDEGNNDNQLVLNSIIWPDSSFVATLTKSTSILSGDQIGQITGGTLDLYENGTLLTQITSSTGHFYASGIKPKAGKSYRIVVNSNGKQIEAETTIPNQVEVLSIDTSSVNDEYGRRTINSKVKIKDPVGDDYYRIVVLKEYLNSSLYRNSIWKYYLTKQLSNISTTDPVFNSLYNNIGDNEIDIGPNNEYSMFPDDYFKGKDYSVQFQIFSQYSYSGYGFKTFYERNSIHVQRLSKELYNYLKYLKLYNYYHDNPFAEPVPVYSNVKNGTGIFAGFNDDTKFTYEKIYNPFSMDTIKVEELINGYGGGY